MPSQLAEAHIEAERLLRQVTAAAVAAAWWQLREWNRADVRRFVERVAPVILVAQRSSVAVTNAYLARAIGRQPQGVNVERLIGAAVRNGTSPEEVYRRPFVTLWTALKNDQPFEQAMKAALERATSTAEMDVQLSMRQTVAAVSDADPLITGFRRVTDGDACALCRIASTQRYHRGDLLPIHNRCGCTVQPIVGEVTGQVIDPELLRQLKDDGEVAKITAQRQRARAREEAGIDEVAIHEHGELGPVLTDPSHSFASR